MIKSLFSVILFTFSIFTFSQSSTSSLDYSLHSNNFMQDSLNEFSIKPQLINNLELPLTSNNEEIITHSGYSFSFSHKDKQALWVAYQLTDKETVKLFDRSNKFLQDKSVVSGTASDGDYKGSGYDRGHLAPAADMGWSAKAMAESFYYSNMSPQLPSFNRGIWKQLEELVRTWAIQNEEIYIVTGGVLNDELPTIGKGVSVPKYFYKVILDYKEPSIKGIGFIIPNESSQEPLQRYTVSIDSVESFTGINFFYQLPDNQEKVIEYTLSIKSWNWTNDATFNKIYSNKDVNQIKSDQCLGLTKKGQRCKNVTTNTNGYCYLHQDQYIAHK
jgi:endonuclease G